MVVRISHSDPGAVPGASTKARCSAFFAPFGGFWRGRNRIDEGVKGVLLPGMIPPLSGHSVVANDNYAEAPAIAA